MVTSHGSYFIACSLEILFGQFLIKVEAEFLLVQCRELSTEITRFLRPTHKTCQSTEMKDITATATPRLPSKKRRELQILRPQSTARSQLWSRGLHPVGALSMPPLVLIPLGMVRPARVVKKKVQILRPQLTARGQLWSRGLHPVGALSVPPLVQRINRQQHS